MVLGVLSISFFISYVVVLKRLRSLNNEVAQILFFYELMKNNGVSQEDQDIHKENFIKFLSDSREWAFDYIENVQQGIGKFVDEVDPIIKHFDEYGIVVEGSPHHDSMVKISKEIKELKKLLPQDDNA